MFSTTKNKSIVGLDIEAGSVAATEVRANGEIQIAGHGIAPLAPGVFLEGEVTDEDRLAATLKELFSEHKLAKNVRLGIANQRVAVRTLFLPPIENPGELETAIRFQARDHIPMPLDQAVLDWEMIGDTTSDSGERRIEVVVVAARRDMVAAATKAVRKAGLRPVGIDLSAFGMIRALADADQTGVGAAGDVGAPAPAYEQRAAQPAARETAIPEAPVVAKLYCNLGDVTNLAIAQGASCPFTRISAFGIEGIAQGLAERSQLALEHSRQWLVHVGLSKPVEDVEGDPEIVLAARQMLAQGAAKLADELRLSLEYFATQEGAMTVGGVVACGPGTTIPGLVERLQRDLGHPFAIGRPPALAQLDDAAAARLTLSYGLALEN